jgi:hypothetical protein
MTFEDSFHSPTDVGNAQTAATPLSRSGIRLRGKCGAPVSAGAPFQFTIIFHTPQDVAGWSSSGKRADILDYLSPISFGKK